MPAEKLDAATSGFVLATAVTVLANTALACFKDAYIPLRAVMKSIAGLIGAVVISSLALVLWYAFT